ncbi:Phosphatidylethanolamine-binding protein-like protein [Frankliniella fusca]|uniref:Phosphatidylethanolamine-binding protein-like protein n=1 Tax=Frankliniella fusca TaxID=407009 RepID=A0AAE1LZ58_9NEOP|nr:Phosphatidylethanolamine-binding protein-like protein [Frankliniella fusca]
MLNAAVLVVAALSLNVAAAGEDPFVTAGIVPDVTDASPSGKVEVVWENNVKALYGNELTPTQVKALPTVSWPADDNALYTLVMTDPDAPSRTNPKEREFLHFLVGNVPGNDISKGDTLAAYVGSGPPKNSGLHRYVWLAYKQPGRINFDFTPIDASTFAGRPKFSIRKFACKNKLGSPVAGNFFQAQYDDYVPILLATMNVHEALLKKHDAPRTEATQPSAPSFLRIASQPVSRARRGPLFHPFDCTASAPRTSRSSARTMEELAPAIVDVAPQKTVKVDYSTGVSATVGNELTPTQVQDEPTISWEAEDDALYFLAMIDPDAPSRQDPSVAEVIHWQVANIPGNDVSRGDVKFEYRGSGAPKGTGLHRYIFLVFKQPGRLDLGSDRVVKRSRRGRLNWSLRKFAQEHKLGNPIAGNFFLAQWDEYVPIFSAMSTME